MIHATSILRDANQVANDIQQRPGTTGRRRLNAQEIAAALPSCTGFEKMIRYHSLGRPGLSMRQTLDQFYYQTLDSIDRRNQDQVVERYTRKKNWPDHEPRVLVVDQLWLWILGEGTLIVLTSSKLENSS